MGARRLKYKRAVGLRYEACHDDVPAVNLVGDALSADEMVRLAQRFGVPIVENAGLAHSLSELPLDQGIPESLYEAVAIILNQLERLERFAK